jgi:hypothetical protein
MTPTSRATRTTSVIASPREPVAEGDHPLGTGSPASSGGFSVVRTSGDTHNQTAEDQGSIGDDVDGEGRGSDRDADLTNNDASSFGDCSDFGPPNLADLILLDASKCRVPTQVTAEGGDAKETCACGHPAETCKRHAGHRAAERYRHAEGYYQRMAAGRGFQGHGKVCVFYTPAQVVTMRQAELDEMSNLAGGMQDRDDTDEETDQFARGVRFGRATTLGPNPRRDLSPPRNPPASLPSPSVGHSRKPPKNPGRPATLLLPKVRARPTPPFGLGWKTPSESAGYSPTLRRSSSISSRRCSSSKAYLTPNWKQTNGSRTARQAPRHPRASRRKSASQIIPVVVASPRILTTAPPTTQTVVRNHESRGKSRRASPENRAAKSPTRRLLLPRRARKRTKNGTGPRNTRCDRMSPLLPPPVMTPVPAARTMTAPRGSTEMRGVSESRDDEKASLLDKLSLPDRIPWWATRNAFMGC